MIKFTAFFLLAISVTFCTVHKRVHRKGWYVEWNKPIKKTNSHSEENKTVNKNSAEVSSDTKETVKERAVDVYQSEKEYFTDSVLQSDELSEVPSRAQAKISDLSKNAEKLGVKAINAPSNSGNSDSEDEKLVNENSTMISVVMIVGAVVLAAFMVFLLLNLASFESALVATIGIVVLGIGSLLFLSIGLFLLIRQAIEKRHPEKREKRQAKIDKKENDPNYDPNRFNIILGVVILTVVTVLFGVIIGLK